MTLVGNKTDLEKYRQITYAEGEAFADKHNMLFFETSAKLNRNITNIFEDTGVHIYDNIQSRFWDTEKIPGIIYNLNSDPAGGIQQDYDKKCC